MRIGDEIYGDSLSDVELFAAATSTPPVEGWIVDRSGAIAPARMLPIKQFWRLKRLRASRDAMRSDGDRAFDARQAGAAETLAAASGEKISSSDDEVSWFEEGGPVIGADFRAAGGVRDWKM